MATTVRIDPVKLAKFVNSPQGPIFRETVKRATKVQVRAKGYVRKRSRKLERSIVKRVVAGPTPTVLVGSAEGHALVEHDGSKAHLIEPRDASVLRFEVGGVVVYATRVNHPGTTGSKYLERAAKDEGLRFVRVT